VNHWRTRTVALASAVAIGIALAAGLITGSGRVPVPSPAPAVRAALSVEDQVDIYASILAELARATPLSATTTTRAILVSRTILDTCLLPRGVPCRRHDVGRMAPELERSLRAALDRLDVEAIFVDDTAVESMPAVLDAHNNFIDEMYVVHEIVFDSTGVLAADGDTHQGRFFDGKKFRFGYGDSERFRFSRVNGRWRQIGSALLWIT
jgi:hypothetical protein